MSVGIYLHFGLDRLLSFPRPRRHGTDRNPGIAFASLGSTERQYWDSLGDDFGAVFDVTGSDRGGVLRRAIGRYGKGFCLTRTCVPICVKGRGGCYNHRDAAANALYQQLCVSPPPP